MKMDLSHFKKIKEDGTSATLKHPQGHEITIAKNGLSKKLKSDLASLPMHLAEGTTDGPVEDPNAKYFQQEPQSSQAPQQPPQQQAAPGSVININIPNQGQQQPEQPPAVAQQRANPHPIASAAGKAVGENIREGAGAIKNYYNALYSPVASFTKALLPEEAGASVPQSPVDQAPPSNYPLQQAPAKSPEQPQASQQGGVAQDYMGAMGSALKSGMSGIALQSQAEQQLAKSQVAANQMAQAEYLNQMDTYKKAHQEITEKVNKVSQELLNKEIDPNRYMNSRTTGAKIMNAIGLMLGGIGSGITGQENLAASFIKDKINADIDAQKQDLNKKNNLLSAYMHEFGNLNDATAALRATYANYYDSKIKESAAIAGTPMAQARAAQLRADLVKSYAPALADMAWKASLAGGMGGANMEMMPEDMRKRAVRLPNGKIGLSPTEKDAGEVRTSVSNLTEMDHDLAEMEKMATQKGTSVNPWSAYSAEAKQKMDSVKLRIGTLHGINRLTDSELHMYNDMVSNPSQWNTTKALAQIRGLRNFVKNKLNFELTNKIENYSPSQSTGSSAARPVVNVPYGYR
jgi:hypothetical protein